VPAVGWRSLRTPRVSASRVGNEVVVVGAPTGQRCSGLSQRCKQRLVQQFVAGTPLKAFNDGVLDRLAQCNVILDDHSARKGFKVLDYRELQHRRRISNQRCSFEDPQTHVAAGARKTRQNLTKSDLTPCGVGPSTRSLRQS
jgi:hypothetical protein